MKEPASERCIVCDTSKYRTGLLTPTEAAALLGVSERTISRRIADGTVKAVRLHGSRRILATDLPRLWS